MDGSDVNVVSVGHPVESLPHPEDEPIELLPRIGCRPGQGVMVVREELENIEPN